jgi:hypothetical protein
MKDPVGDVQRMQSITRLVKDFIDTCGMDGPADMTWMTFNSLRSLIAEIPAQPE